MATPEIPTTNGGSSRHMACKLCRDRKVRCGGEQPECEKCRRAGEHCVYLSTQKPSKADLAQRVAALQKRLAEAETIINRTKVSSDVTTHASLSSHNLGTPGDANSQEAQSQVSNASGGVNESIVGDSNPGIHQKIPIIEDDLRICSMDEYMNIDSFDASVYPQDVLAPRRGVDQATGAAILGPITRFSSAMFRSQAETLVMASVVADCIAWLRKASPGGGIPNVSESPVYLGMLDNIEIRLRELCEMSRSRSTTAMQELVNDLGAIAPPGGEMAARLDSLEGDLQREARERAEVFRSRYNPCALLSEQSRNTEKWLPMDTRVLR